MALSNQAQNAVRQSLRTSYAVGQEVVDVLNVSQVLSSTEAGFLDSVTAGTLAASKAVVLNSSGAIADNNKFSLGTGADDAFYHKSTSTNANTAVTGVIVGTPVVPALAADSLLITNTTADGDILIAGQTGGNTTAAFVHDSSASLNILPVSNAFGSNATDRVTIKGIYMSPANVAVTVPSIANDAAENADEVAVDVSGAFSMQPAVGDAVIAMPQEALPTDCVLCGAWVSGTDTITVSFASKEGGGGVTGAAKNFKFLIFDVT